MPEAPTHPQEKERIHALHALEVLNTPSEERFDRFVRIGISKANADKLFQPFSQGDVSVSRTYGGTGLGLVICKQLTELMGGTITLSSTPDQGSTFQVTLPVERASAPAESDRSQLFTDSGPTVKRILVIEDNPINRQVLHYLLQSERPVEILNASSGQEALALLDKYRPVDTILLDLSLGEEDGHSLMEQIRNWEERVDATPARIFAHTADLSRKTRDRCLAAGMTDVIDKPVVPEELRNQVFGGPD